MKKHILYPLALVLLFLGTQTVSAQENKTKSPPKVARFITFSFKPDGLHNDRYSLYQFELGYEQFIGRKTSIIGGVSYGIGKQYIKTFQGEILDEFDLKRYSIHTGLRYRFLNKGKFSLFGELQLGVRREVVDYNRRSKHTSGFLEASFGAEYRFTDRFKATLGVSGHYSSSLGLATPLSIGLQFGFGKKK